MLERLEVFTFYARDTINKIYGQMVNCQNTVESCKCNIKYLTKTLLRKIPIEKKKWPERH